VRVAMRDQPFETPLAVAGGWRGRSDTLASAAQAAQFLVDHWPNAGRGLKYRNALKACMDVLEGRKRIEAARKAFLQAAGEAGLSVHEESADIPPVNRSRPP
jgi:hypothetical protein